MAEKGDPQQRRGVIVRHRFLIEGRVQGVGFRYATVRQAERLGLTGWVRNLTDGRVEVEAHGDGGAMDALENWLWQGPAHARVDRVTRSGADPADHGSFRARRDSPWRCQYPE